MTQATLQAMTPATLRANLQSPVPLSTMHLKRSTRPHMSACSRALPPCTPAFAAAQVVNCCASRRKAERVDRHQALHEACMQPCACSCIRAQEASAHQYGQLRPLLAPTLHSRTQTSACIGLFGSHVCFIPLVCTWQMLFCPPLQRRLRHAAQACSTSGCASCCCSSLSMNAPLREAERASDSTARVMAWHTAARAQDLCEIKVANARVHYLHLRTSQASDSAACGHTCALLRQQYSLLVWPGSWPGNLMSHRRRPIRS